MGPGGSFIKTHPLGLLPMPCASIAATTTTTTPGHWCSVCVYVCAVMYCLFLYMNAGFTRTTRRSQTLSTGRCGTIIRVLRSCTVQKVVVPRGQERHAGRSRTLSVDVGVVCLVEANDPDGDVYL